METSFTRSYVPSWKYKTFRWLTSSTTWMNRLVYVNWEDKYGGALWVRHLNNMTRSWFSHRLIEPSWENLIIISSIRVLISANSKIRASLLWWIWREFKREMLVLLQFVQTGLQFCSLSVASAFASILTGGNWQKWKRVFLTCPCHKIYRDEADGLKSCKYTWKIMKFVKMENLGQYRENLIFCQ